VFRRRPRFTAFAAVDGQTPSTLGSAYAPPGTRRHGAARWLRPARVQLTLAAHASARCVGVVSTKTLCVCGSPRGLDQTVARAYCIDD